MKKMTLIATVAFAGLAMTSCKKEVDPETPVATTPNGTQLTQFFNNNVAAGTQSFTLNASTGGTVTGVKGTRVTIYPGMLLDAANQPVTGNVTVTLVEVYDRATMVLMDKATVGILPNGDHSTLISGGEYYLKITQNGQPLHSNWGIKVNLPVDNTGGADFGMSVFNGAEIEEAFVWEIAEDTINVVEDTVGQGGWTMSYEILDGSWGWTNVDRFYNDPRPKTVLKAELPEGYDNTNCEVYITYDGEPTALAALDVFTNGYFSEHYGLIPIGLEVHFIAVTMINGQLHYAIQGATITNNHVEHITSFTPISQADLAVLINNLP